MGVHVLPPAVVASAPSALQDKRRQNKELIAKGHEDVDTIERNSFQREKMSAHPA
jgi:hypothetical protein